MQFIEYPNISGKFTPHLFFNHKISNMKEYLKIAVVALVVVLIYDKWLKNMIAKKMA